MCLLTMTNDGGLRAVLDTSDIVSRELLALGRYNNERSRCRDQEVQELAEKTDVLDFNDDSVRSGTKRHASRTLSELSYDFSSKKMNLSLNTSQELKQAVSPLIEKMESIDAAALLSLNPSAEANGAKLDPEGHLTVPPIHDRITPSYANDGSNIVRYLHVKEVPNKFSAGIFVFPPNAEIPLHDHPGMVVISRVLYGELKVHSYDVLSPSDTVNSAKVPKKQEKVMHPPSSSSEAKEHDEGITTTPAKESVFRSSLRVLKDFVRLTWQDDEDSTHIETDSDASDRRHSGANPIVLQAKKNQFPMGVEKYETEGECINILSAPHVTCLYPKEGNCHAFVAGPNGAAVLDVSSVSPFISCIQ
jgi:hypothetical protein